MTGSYPEQGSAVLYPCLYEVGLKVFEQAQMELQNGMRSPQGWGWFLLEEEQAKLLTKSSGAPV